jgi:hypothetical protein
MANTTSSTDVTSVDFDTNRARLQAFLQSQDQFKDYNFEGSTLSILLDLLAYNTFNTAFYTNMALAEAFLDSAVLKSSIVSHAKELNYLPKSATSSVANVTVTFQASGASAPYTIPKGSPFTTLVKSQSYTFTTPESIVVTSSNTTFTFTTDIYEGSFVSDSYVYPAITDADLITSFRITNQTVDTTSIEVRVFEDGSQYGDIYTATDTLLGLNGASKVFFLQATDNGYYEVLFGDNIFGRKPKAGALINIEYRVTSGSAANGSKVFSCDFDPTGVGELSDSPVTVTNQVAITGTDPQSIESIRTYAPRYFASQQRAVASDDYKSLVLSKFYGDIDDVQAYGGELNEPKLYGRTIVVIKPVDGEIAPDVLKNDVANYMLKLIAVPSRIVLKDPDYFYVAISSVVQYNKTLTNKSALELKGIVQTAIHNYSADNLEKFGADFRYSRFVRQIDNCDDSIVSNDTEVLLSKRLVPKLDFETSFEINFGNAIYNEGTRTTKYIDEPVITSSPFTYVAADGTNYPNSYINDDNTGTLYVYTYINNQLTIVNSDIGTVNYTTGKVTINNLLVSQYSNYISLYAKLAIKDILMSTNKILFIDLDDVTLTIVEQFD